MKGRKKMEYTEILKKLSENGVKKYDDYPQCCVGGHNEHNCEDNIKAKVKFEEHNKTIDDCNTLFAKRIARIEEVIKAHEAIYSHNAIVSTEKLTQSLTKLLTGEDQ